MCRKDGVQIGHGCQGTPVRGCLERMVNQVQKPGIKSNSKMIIFDNHLAPIYYICENIYPNVASTVRA